MSLTASLYANQLYGNLFLLQSSVEAISTRVLVQSALQRYNNGNTTAENWVRSQQDIQIGLGGSGLAALLLQCRVVSKNGTGALGPYPLLNVTGNIPPVTLPGQRPDGTPLLLGDDGPGYPPNLYPNLTFTSSPINSTYNESTAFYEGRRLGADALLFLGPWIINETFALASITTPIINNTSSLDYLGWLTIVLSCDSIFNVLESVKGLGKTGQVLIVGPDTENNRLGLDSSSDHDVRVPLSRTDAKVQPVRYVLPPQQRNGTKTRHSRYGYGARDSSFQMQKYPAVVDAYTNIHNDLNHDGSHLTTKNEEGKTVSVGYALTGSDMVDWALLVEQSHGEVFAPINHLRNVLVACVFGTTGALLLLTFPLAHFAVRPIRRLREATKKTVEPYQVSGDGDEYSIRSSIDPSETGEAVEGEREATAAVARKEGFVGPFGKMSEWREARKRAQEEKAQRKKKQAFRIPGRVQDHKHVVHDELTDLTTTFNAMSEELMMQYERLEERVRERTSQLALSQRAAEAANESKTLFIANISHELKTPLNGILGMCAVCMQENDLSRIKRSLNIIYKSGDLLLHLLTDLLTFSRNQIGQQLALEEREFKIADVSSQVLSIFEKQAKDGGIQLGLTFQGPADLTEPNAASASASGFGPPGTGRIMDMFVWGDQYRVLQVIINLVSNSLKFTPPGGSVNVRIKCLGETLERAQSRKESLASKRSAQTLSQGSKRRGRKASGLSGAITKPPQRGDSDYSDTALQINKTQPMQISNLPIRERSDSPPPANAKTLLFEFEVEDTGPGIPKSQQQKVFEPFMQGDLGLSKKYGGTGLGLSICSQLASLMRGSISLDSNEGVGSRFTMTIPLLFIKERAGSTRSSIGGGGSRRNSLNLDGSEASYSPQKNQSADDVSTHSIKDGTSAPILTSMATPVKPRLVGLSQPFFASTSPLESPEQQLEVMKTAAERVSKNGDKLRVLVAEDNTVNQEVVLRMLKLEDIYSRCRSRSRSQ